MSVFDLDDAAQGGVFGDVPANPSTPFQLPAYANDVFATVAGVATDYLKSRNVVNGIKANNDFELRKLQEQTNQTRIIAQAAPGALAGGWLQNLLPNQWQTTNPRAETLPMYSMPSVNPVTLIIMAIVAIVLIAFARK